uniref:Caspase-2-like n=1 Tax=Crassostrea virginica TaxID=6565 RepID=A0A8B8ETX0_CRAVI|nr:caspase-2-like [Crassostrea virginica]
MDQIHKDALRRTRVALVKDLNVDHISDDLLAKDIFTPLMMEYIMSERTRIDKVRRLLDDLVRRGPNAYKSFLEVLNDTRHDFLAEKILRNEEIIRREKDPHSSIPVQEVNPGISNSVQHLSSVSLGSSSTPLESSILNSRNSELQSYHPPSSGLIVSEMESADSNEDDILNLDPSQPLNPTSMDIDDDDSRLSPDDLQSGPERQPVQLSDDNKTQYNLGPSSSFSTYDSFYIKDKCYKMDSDPRGVVLIINNSKFEKDYGERQGTEHDCRKLKELFEGFKFKVFVKENLRAIEMMREFHEFSKNPWLEKVDCMVLAVLSHGQKDVICGIDGGGIDVLQKIVPIFSSKECPSLAGKPKMYICNACRGGKNGQALEIRCSQSIQRDELQRDGPNSFSENKIQIQETRDILLCFSTFPGYASYRDPDQGTWFIQEFVNVFAEQAHDEHVLDMMTAINKRVSQKQHRDHIDEAAWVQMPFPASSLIEKWFLNPPPLAGATGFSH